MIIQGGMGAGVSNWRLARAVSWLGQLGVVAGTALDQILSRRLQDGDVGGHIRRAPAWLRTLRLEFLYRILKEPRKQLSRCLGITASLPAILLEEKSRQIPTAS